MATGRVRYHKGDRASSIAAARRAAVHAPVYVWITGNGYTLSAQQPPYGVPHMRVEPSGAAVTVDYAGNEQPC